MDVQWPFLSALNAFETKMHVWWNRAIQELGHEIIVSNWPNLVLQWKGPNRYMLDVHKVSMWVCVCLCVCVKEVAQTLKLTNLVRTRVQEKPLNWPKSDSEHQNFALGPFLQRCSWSLIWPSLSDSGRGTAAFGPSLHTSVQYQDVKTYQDVSRRIKTYQDVPGYQVTLCSQHYSTSQSLRCFWVNKAGEGMSRGNSYFPVKNIHRVLFYYKTGTSTNWRELVNVDVSWAPECLEVWPFENIQCS